MTGVFGNIYSRPGPSPGEDCEDSAHENMCTCLVGRCNSTTIAPIDFILLTQEVLYPRLGPPLRGSGSGTGSGLETYAMTSNEHYDENMHYDVIIMCVISSEGLPSRIALFY